MPDKTLEGVLNVKWFGEPSCVLDFEEDSEVWLDEEFEPFEGKRVRITIEVLDAA